MVFSYIASFFNYLFSKDLDEEDEEFLADQLLELEFADKENTDYVYNETSDDPSDVPKDKQCFSKTGVISYFDTNNNYVLIDGLHYFDVSSCTININHNDKVLYLGYYKENGSVVIVRILENQGSYWGEDDTLEEIKFQQTEHTLLGQVKKREGRFVYMTKHDLKFSLDDVDGTFIPIAGDLLEMSCTVKTDEEKPIGISSAEVLEVTSFRPLGAKIYYGSITEWNGEHGICDRKIYFDRQCLPSGVELVVGMRVIMKTIESIQGDCNCRAIELELNEQNTQMIIPVNVEEEESSLQIERDKDLDITFPISFDLTDFYQQSEKALKVTNNSTIMYVINKWIVLSKKRDSQVIVTPPLNNPYRLYPGKSFSLTIKCQPRFLGRAKEVIVIIFKGFKVKREININVTINNTNNHETGTVNNTKRLDSSNAANMRQILNNSNGIIYGTRLKRAANFVSVRLGTFAIPDRMWNIILGDSKQLIHTNDFDKVLSRTVQAYPFLNQNLNVYNYMDRWHTLTYMDEIQRTLDMRAFDIAKTFLLRYQEYLGLEVNGLSERRPSLIVGDRVLVKDVYDHKAPKYEGFIHEIRGNCILLKFSQAFHESYLGSDVSVEFYFGRVPYRRMHHAINLAISNLGPEIIFPSRATTRPPQIPPDNLNSIVWCNESLNKCQKAAVSNILLGECRPKPYVIYGPPGTGKTVFVVETIIQILKYIPHSRVLVATPSNSAANLITERLVNYKEKNPHSFVRVIAKYWVESENIPVKIRPHCVTVDISTERSSKPKHEILNGVTMNCQTSFIGRHRVTIGTCNILGTLAQMGFPKGHFTHVIVDEAGQATEPEIMIPLTLTDKDNGQIIIAGDPMQLGPVVMSRFCTEFGLEESYLSRILETFPYQKDYSAFQDGFNEKLVMRLIDNYRSLKEVIVLPSEMFYDGCLLENIDRNQKWVHKIIDVVSDIFVTDDVKVGGIFVHGVRGHNTRAEDSPSWYNPQEATMLALTASKIFKKGVSVDDIGIITPYIAQIKYIRSLFEGMGLPLPKTGTVEEFQGQERPLIMISTVRSTETLLAEDLRNALGFVKCPKRLNVALTRAQVAALLFCDPHLLCTDPLWRKVVNQAVKEDKYMGCDLPNIFNS